MAAMANNSLTSQAKWSDVSVSLKEFTTKYPTPNLAKVTKGQYKNIGVAKTVHNELLVHSVKKTLKVLAETVKIKDSKRIPVNEQKFSLPITYQGWFELLSEDGKAIRPIGLVGDLVKVFPPSCLVRENMKGFIPKDNGELTLEKTRQVYAGEHLTLVGDITIPVVGNKGFTKKRLLRCFDQKGDSVYFSFDQKGLFSPVAGQGNISGVHNIKSLVEKFRLPITVRLVHGIIPSRLDKSNFTGAFRLISVYSDETVFISPLKRDAKMVPISTREPLKLSVATNVIDLKETEDFKYHFQRNSKMVASYMNSIHVLVNIPSDALLKAREEQMRMANESSTDKVTSSPSHEQDILFDEIDDIYQYVRDGGPPPKPRPRPSIESIYPMPHRSQDMSFGESQSQKQDDDYWEEPIYEQIATVQKKKQAMQSMPVVQTGSSVTTGPSSEPVEKKKVYRYLSTESLTSRPLSFIKTEPVGPAQQAQDIGFQHSTSTTDLLDEITSNTNSTQEVASTNFNQEVAPPLPPKTRQNIVENLDQRTTPPLVSKNELSSSPTSISYPAISSPPLFFNSQSQGSYISSNSSYVTTSQVPYPAHITKLPGSGVIQYPRYVAVARVGDSDSEHSDDGSGQIIEDYQLPVNGTRNDTTTGADNQITIETTQKNLQTLHM